MAFRRVIAPRMLIEGEALTRAMVGIGMNFAARGDREANIEDTLLAASLEALERDDLRVLAVLVTWLGVHHPWINVDRLNRLVSEVELPRVKAFWSAIGQWLKKDRRFSKLTKQYDGPRLDLLRTGTEFQLSRRGEDARFVGSSLRIPAGVLRDRVVDVLSPRRLAQRHRGYRCRVLMGPSYRADMWALLERTPEISAAELARRAYGSFATAWQAKNDWQLLAT